MDPLNTEFVRLLDNSGWKQARAARELHTTTATISRYVNGKMRPRPQVVAHLAHLTNQIANLTGELRAQVDDRQPMKLEEWERELVATIRRVPVVKRRGVVEGLIAGISAFDGAGSQDVNKSPLKEGHATGTGSDPVLDGLHQQAKAIVKKLIDDRKFGGVPRRKTRDEPTS